MHQLKPCHDTVPCGIACHQHLLDNSIYQLQISSSQLRGRKVVDARGIKLYYFQADELGYLGNG